MGQGTGAPGCDMPGAGKLTMAAIASIEAIGQAVLRLARNLRSCRRARKATWPKLISGLAREVADGRAREAVLTERLAWYQALMGHAPHERLAEAEKHLAALERGLTAAFEYAGVTPPAPLAPLGGRHLHIAGDPH